MGYQVLLRRAVQKQLEGLAQHEYAAVELAISGLQEEPRPRGVKKLSESGLWRIRVGRFRVVYAVDDAERVVTLVRVARRAEQTYRNL